MLRSGVVSRWRSLVATLATSVLLCVVALAPTASAGLAVELPGDPALITLIAAEQTLLELTNADRMANGLAPLELDYETLLIARQRAASQLGTPALSHYDTNGELAFARLLTDAQVPYELAGENLARASTADSTVTQRIEQALMASHSHRKNILEHTFKRVAIGAATDPKGQIAFAELYRN
jgi:uncharacterized protein YkwD